MGAASADQEAIARILIAGGADVNARDSEGETALLYASGAGSASVIRLLLSAKAEVNIQDRKGETALMEAAWKGHSQVVQDLIGAGADPLLADNAGHTAVALAMRTKHGGIESALRKAMKSAVVSANRPVTTAHIGTGPEKTSSSGRAFSIEKPITPKPGEDFPFTLPHPR